MAPVAAALAQRDIACHVIHTGQHTDANLSQVFFDELGLPQPDVFLDIRASADSQHHGALTAAMLTRLEALMLDGHPEVVLVYGDTNTTLAATLAAVKLHIAVVHVEAGPRTGDREAPEEINRWLIDRVARLNACPDALSLENLAREGLQHTALFTGDVMQDAFLHFAPRAAAQQAAVLARCGLAPDTAFALLTVHRPDNTDRPEPLRRLLEMLRQLPMPVVFPIHPRTRAALLRENLWEPLAAMPDVHCLPPLGYLDTLSLLQQATVVLTDSGGLQKEGFFAGKPVLTLLHNTPWPQIEAAGWLRRCWPQDDLANGIDVSATLAAVQTFRPTGAPPPLFGEGRAAACLLDGMAQRGLLPRTAAAVAR